VAGATLQILFKAPRQFQSVESGIKFDFPRLEFGRMRGFAGVVVKQALFQVARIPAIKLCRINLTLQNVSVKHFSVVSGIETAEKKFPCDGLPSVARNCGGNV
jgi:hypothetical protein